MHPDAGLDPLLLARLKKEARHSRASFDFDSWTLDQVPASALVMLLKIVLI